MRREFKKKVLNDRKVSITTLYFHAGQCYAMEGEDFYLKAIQKFEKSYKRNKIYTEWNLYVKGTIAFLKKDKKNTIKALDLLTKLSSSKYTFHEQFLKKCVSGIDENITYESAYSKE